jgi:hypothetical protein
MKPEAQRAYDDVAYEIKEELIERLLASLEAHKHAAKHNPTDWSVVGDLQRVEDDIKRVLYYFEPVKP